MAIGAIFIACAAGGIGAGAYFAVEGQYLFAFFCQNPWFF